MALSIAKRMVFALSGGLLLLPACGNTQEAKGDAAAATSATADGSAAAAPISNPAPNPVATSAANMASSTAALSGLAAGAAAIDAGLVADFIIVDKSDRALVLFKDRKEIVRYTGIRFGDDPAGHKHFQGDEKTPEGLYKIELRNPQSAYHLSLKVSYPNEEDRAFAAAQGRSPGGDIFLHGQPNGYNGPTIARDWTDGCVALSNPEIRQIWQLVPDGIPIRIQP